MDWLCNIGSGNGNNDLGSNSVGGRERGRRKRGGRSWNELGTNDGLQL